MRGRIPGDYHKGWAISEIPANPITGRWVAVRHGVELCANTREMLIRMIDTRPQGLSWPDSERV